MSGVGGAQSHDCGALGAPSRRWRPCETALTCRFFSFTAQQPPWRHRHRQIGLDTLSICYAAFCLHCRSLHTSRYLFLLFLLAFLTSASPRPRRSPSLSDVSTPLRTTPHLSISVFFPLPL